MNTPVNYIVKKFNLNLNQPQPVKIESIGRSGLAKLFAELGFKKGVEIGVDRGAFSEILCQANQKLQLFSIDAWSTSAFEDPLNTSEKMQKQFENHYQDAKRRLAHYNCKIIRKKSLDAVKDFEDNSLDFIYIDSNHNFVEVASDIYRWEKKVKVGGIISGHDYLHFPPTRDNHVKHVVDAYIRAFEISPYFELGQDRYPSGFG